MSSVLVDLYRKMKGLTLVQIGIYVNTNLARVSARTGWGFETVPGHVDPAHISSFIYLNTPGQCSGGTGIYRHIPSGKMRFIQKAYSLTHVEKEPLTKPLNYSAGEWQLLHKFDMQYNRLIAFNSSVIHKIFFEPEGHAYTAEIDQARLSLNSFFVYSK